MSNASKILERVRTARANHPECDRHSDEGPITCGWKLAVLDIDAALASEPEPKRLRTREALVEEARTGNREREARQQRELFFAARQNRDSPEQENTP